MRCPACLKGDGEPGRRFTVQQAAEHFVPQQRDPARHVAMVEHLRQLWDGDSVEIHGCPVCGFGFAVPWVGGDERFYGLAHQANPHYPSDRWEFGQTLKELNGPVTLAEIGAGDGAFLDQLQPMERIVAADFDSGAVARLHEKGYEALQGSVADLIDRGPFEVVCMFQTLEHMADTDQVFTDLRKLTTADGSVFLSVPHGHATAFQERAAGLWDMPPNHVGRWTPPALREAAGRNGFDAVAIREEPVNVRAITTQLAVSAVNARAYTPGTFAARVNAVKVRPVRGALKRLLAIGHVPALLAQQRKYRPWTLWAHLKART